jgi:cytosine/adenosine deaminase-related metal-dependent hydrolase
MPNLHSHAFQRGMAGLVGAARGASEDSFWTWREVMYRFLDRLDPDDVQAIAAQAFVEMLEGGFTALAEFHYLHHDKDGRAYADIAEMAGAIAAAAEETGLGLTCCRCSTVSAISAAHLPSMASAASSMTATLSAPDRGERGGDPLAARCAARPRAAFAARGRAR